MIAKIPFGSTGHVSSRTLFGAAALGAMKQTKADAVLEWLQEYDINHIDTAASYGEAELRLAPWLQKHRDDFFLATKAHARDKNGVMESIENSRQRMQVDQIDLIQFHNLTDEEGWQTVFGKDGGLAAAIEARDKGLVRFIGVTGHGTAVADMHLRSLEKFDFDSVLLPYNVMMMRDPLYAASFEKLYEICQEKGIAMQTIKSIARRRWQEGDESKKFSWYEPIRDETALRHAVHWVLSRPGVFLNTSSDATLLRQLLQAARDFGEGEGADSDVMAQMTAHAGQLAMEPLFERGVTDTI